GRLTNRLAMASSYLLATLLDEARHATVGSRVDGGGGDRLSARALAVALLDVAIHALALLGERARVAATTPASWVLAVLLAEEEPPRGARARRGDQPQPGRHAELVEDRRVAEASAAALAVGAA